MSILRRSRESSRASHGGVGPRRAFRALAPIRAGLSRSPPTGAPADGLMAGLTPEDRLTQLEQLFKTEQNVCASSAPTSPSGGRRDSSADAALERFVAAFDYHYGFELDAGKLVPLHDERSMNAVLAFAADFKPDVFSRATCSTAAR